VAAASVPLGLVLLMVVAVEFAAPLMDDRTLPTLVLPVPAPPAAAAADLAASASYIVSAQPLFAASRRPLPVAPGPNQAPADRISGIIMGSAGAIALMQPKDGSKPVGLHVGDKFDGAPIIAIDASGLMLVGGRRIAPQFAAAAAAP
jgi:hypothetical protein